MKVFLPIRAFFKPGLPFYCFSRQAWPADKVQAEACRNKFPVLIDRDLLEKNLKQLTKH